MLLMLDRREGARSPTDTRLLNGEAASDWRGFAAAIDIFQLIFRHQIAQIVARQIAREVLGALKIGQIGGQLQWSVFDCMREDKVGGL